MKLLYGNLCFFVFNCFVIFVNCSVHSSTNGLVPKSPPLKPLDNQVINSPLSSSSPLTLSASAPSIVSHQSYRSSIPSFPDPRAQLLPIPQPIISPNQPHLTSGLTGRIKSKLSSIPFLSKLGLPKADKRALNLVRLTNQYKRGIPNAMALYHAILEQHERRWMLDSPEFRFQFPPGHPERMMEASNRKVGKVVNRIMSSFIGDCVGVVITEIFRKMGEVAGEVARLVISNAARHILGREELSVRQSLPSLLPTPGKTVNRIIQAIKPKMAESKKTA